MWKKYLFICRKREYEIINTTFPSRIEVRVGASWGAVGKLIIELIPSDEGSLIQTRFQPISGEVIAVGCGLIVFITAIEATIPEPSNIKVKASHSK